MGTRKRFVGFNYLSVFDVACVSTMTSGSRGCSTLWVSLRPLLRACRALLSESKFDLKRLKILIEHEEFNMIRVLRYGYMINRWD